MRLGPLPRIMTFFRSVGSASSLGLIARVEIWREALELRRACVHAIEDCANALLLARDRELASGRLPRARERRLSEMPSRLAFSNVSRDHGLERTAVERLSQTQPSLSTCCRNQGSMAVIS